jgi:hypothetical protein
MAQGTGYICSWTVGNEAGRIHVCGGNTLPGDDVAFAFVSCSAALKAILQTKDISEEEECPPPDGSLRVRFDFDIQNGMDVAINVRLL